MAKKENKKKYTLKRALKNFEDPNSMEFKGIMGFLQNLQGNIDSATGSPYSTGSVLTRALTSGLSTGGDPLSGGILASASLISGLLGSRKEKKRRRAQLREMRRKQVQEITEFFQDTENKLSTQLTQEKSKFASDFIDLENSIEQGARAYSTLVSDSGVVDVTSQRRRAQYAVEADTTIESLTSSTERAINMIEDKISFITKARKKIAGTTNADLGRSFLQSYAKGLRSGKFEEN